MNNNKVIMWDFDGVIADTFHQCYAISKLAHPDMTEKEYRARFEGNINKAQQRTTPVREIDFFAEFAKSIFDANLTEHIAETITTLSQEYTQVIVSSTVSHLIDQYLTKHNLRAYFKEILGNDIAHSKVEKFNLVFKKYDTSHNHSVLITDTLGDILEANEVNLKSIAVSWGFQTKETLAKGKPYRIIENPIDLTQTIKEILA